MGDDPHGELKLMDDETVLAVLNIDDFQLVARPNQKHPGFWYLQINLSGAQWDEIKGLAWVRARTLTDKAT